MLQWIPGWFAFLTIAGGGMYGTTQHSKQLEKEQKKLHKKIDHSMVKSTKKMRNHQ